VGDHLVADEAAVDEDVLAVLGVGGASRVDGETGNRQRAGGGLKRPGGGEEIVAKDVGDAPGAVGWRQLEQVAAVMRGRG